MRPTDLLDAYLHYVRTTITAPHHGVAIKERVAAAAREDPLLQSLMGVSLGDDGALRTTALAELSAAAASLVQKGFVDSVSASDPSSSHSIAAGKLTFVPV